jgi:AraC family transcriptional regulator, arabinose operon regulatory protein
MYNRIKDEIKNRFLHIDAVTLFNFTGRMYAHTHDCWELAYVVSGKGICNLNGIDHEISTGTLLIIKPGDSHYESGTIDESVEIFFLKIRNDAAFIQTFSLPFSGSAFIHAHGKPEVEQILKNILIESLEEKKGYEYYIEAELVKLFVIIGRTSPETDRDTACNESLSELIHSKQLKTVSQIKHYMDENLCKDISLNDISNRFYISPQHLIRLFKAVTGCAPKQYITLRKIEKAKEMLCNTSLKIDRISDSLGYNNIHYFYRMFKKATSQTPLQFRQTVKDHSLS